MMKIARWSVLLLVLSAVSGAALAETRAFLKIPGVPGTSQVNGRTDWIDIDQHALNVAPAVMADKKTIQTQCSASLSGIFGAAAPKIAELTGTTIAGDVQIEVDILAGPLPQPFYSATLKGAVIRSYASSEATSAGFHDSLSMAFNQLVLSVRQQKPDGTFDLPQVGTFDCLRVP
jgi:type VI protein secretion system component Hcp